jgi:hypothetical protein
MADMQRKQRLVLEDDEGITLNVSTVRRSHMEKVRMLAVVWNSTVEFALDVVLAGGLAAYDDELRRGIA